jgi:hypothetical protein
VPQLWNINPSALVLDVRRALLSALACHPCVCGGVFPIVFVALSCPSVSVGCFRWLLSQACFLARPAAAAAADVSCGCLVLMLLGLGGEPAVLLPAARVSLRPSCLRAAAVPLCLQRWPVAVLLGEQ